MARRRLPGRPHRLTESQCEEAVALHRTRGFTYQQLAARYGVSRKSIERAFASPLFRDIERDFHDEGAAKYAAAMHLMRCSTLKAMETIAAAVDNGDLKECHYVLDWHKALMPQQVEINGQVIHQHAAQGEVAEAVASLTSALRQAKIPSIERFISRGGVEDVTPLPSRTLGGEATVAPTHAAPNPASTHPTKAEEAPTLCTPYLPPLDGSVPEPKAPWTLALPQPGKGRLHRGTDGHYYLGSPPDEGQR